MDAGLNLINTAPGHEDGYSEAIVGSALRGHREGMFVIDKVDDLEKPAGPQVDASLKALGLDTVDLFVFHAVSELARWKELSEVLDRWYQVEGKPEWPRADYFKVRAANDGKYLLKHDLESDEWFLGRQW